MTRLAALILAASLGFAAPLPAAAQDAPQSEIRAVIDAQIDAFRADDGSKAYSYAAPGIRQIFPTPEIFMSMVKSGYQPVYRPKSVTYGSLRNLEGQGWVQEVFLVGPDGDTYTALYALQQQPDGSWKIAGCRIVKAPAQSA